MRYMLMMNAVRGHLLEMAGDHGRAVVHYQAAAERTASIPERNYLITKAARTATSSAPLAVQERGSTASARLRD